MQTKLTLRLEEVLIRRAKEHARRRDTSVSKLVADFFRMLEAPDGEPEAEGDVSPAVQQLLGVLRDGDVERADYYRYLENKHR